MLLTTPPRRALKSRTCQGTADAVNEGMKPNDRQLIVHPEKHIPLAVELVEGGIQPENSLETREARAQSPTPEDEKIRAAAVIRVAAQIAIGDIPGADDPDPSKP